MWEFIELLFTFLTNEFRSSIQKILDSNQKVIASIQENNMSRSEEHTSELQSQR